MKSIKLIAVLMAVVPTLFFIGCNKKAQQTSRVAFKLTDAPAQFDALNIDVQGIQVHTQAQGWVTLNSNVGVINILDYVNGASTLIAQTDLQAGNIDQVRLVLGSNNSITVNGVTTQLSAPSALQGGLQLNLTGRLQAGGNYEFTIDFDAAQSVITSAAGHFELRPTIRLIVDASGSANAGSGSGTSGSISGDITGNVSAGASTGGSGGSGSGTGGGSASVVVNGSTAGNITGTIGTTAGLAVVTATNASGQAVSTITDLNGHFTLSALQSGTYTVSVSPMLLTLSGSTMQNVSVAAGQTTNLGLVAL